MDIATPTAWRHHVMCSGERMHDRIPALDGLRGIAVIAVVLFHSGFTWISGGWLGVDVFFVLSGYLITSQLLQPGWTWAGFMLRRMARLYPAMLVFGVVVGLASSMFDGEPFIPALAGLAYLSTPLVSFDVLPANGYLGHLWSLAIEGQFYMLWGLVMLWGRSWPRRRLVAVCLVGSAASMLGKASLLVVHLPAVAYAATPVRLEGLLLGSAVAAGFRVPTGRSGVLLSTAAAAAAFGWADGMRWYQGPATVMAVACTAILVAVVNSPHGGRLTAALSARWLRWFGTRSYSLYLWHWPVYRMLNYRDSPEPAGGWLLVAVPLSVVLAEVSYRVVEGPGRQIVLRIAGSRPRQPDPSR